MPIVLVLLMFIAGLALGNVNNRAGYQFVDGHSHTTIHFDRYKDLIVIPVVMNDTVTLRLVLDTGTRSMLLYGKKFRGLKNLRPDKRVRVTGWGSPEGVDAVLSFPNKISLGEIRGEAVGVAIVDKWRMFREVPGIDGIIGYELFARFAVEINYRTKTIRLYDRLPEGHTDQFIALPLEVNHARPQIESEITLANNRTIKIKLLIDTGSSLGLALFASSCEGLPTSFTKEAIGLGLNGTVYGFELMVREIHLGNLRVKTLPTHLVDVTEHPDDQFVFAGSLGAAFLKNHIVIFDYPRNALFLGSPRGVSE